MGAQTASTHEVMFFLSMTWGYPGAFSSEPAQSKKCGLDVVSAGDASPTANSGRVEQNWILHLPPFSDP